MKNKLMRKSREKSPAGYLHSNSNFKLSPIVKAVNLSILGLGVLHGASHAATIEVDTHIDSNLIGTSLTYCSLRVAIRSMTEQREWAGCVATGDDFGTNDVITFSDNLTSNTIDLNATYSEIQINRSIPLTISASNISNGITIDANGNSRIFNVLNGNITLDGLTITNGYAVGGSGGGIIIGIDTSLTLNNSTIEGNFALEGGGISNVSQSTLIINNSTISSNTASVFGAGGIADHGSSRIIITNSTITNNTADFIGGARFEGEVTIIGSTISSNVSRYSSSAGGGVAITSSNALVDISDTLIINNRAGSGGGIAISNNGSLTLSNSTVSNNQAVSFGGGIHSYGGNSVIDNTDFDGNTAYYGGAINLKNGSSKITSSTVTGNEALGKGGGVQIDGGLMTLNATDITDNGADQGGGINLENFSSITIGSSSIADNNARYGGGVNIIGNGSLVSNNSSISNNAAGIGGGIKLDFNSNLVATRSSISNNGSNLGGGIFSAGGIATLEEMTLSNNTAIYAGGAVALDETSRFTFTSGTFSRNKSANGRGGAFWIRESSRATINQSTLFANSATYGGAIITYNGGSALLTNTTVSANSAALGGGFLPFNTGRVVLTNATVANNRASDSGGGLFAASGGSVTLRNSIVADSPTGDDCNFYNATISSDTASIIESGGCVSAARKSDPKLEPLADNGGPTLTHALSAGSLALNAGILANCPSIDQRGELRGIDDGFCDVGAFEYNILGGVGIGYLPAILKILLLDEEAQE